VTIPFVRCALDAHQIRISDAHLMRASIDRRYTLLRLVFSISCVFFKFYTKYS
jgi:hypothetical protein